MIIFCEVEVSDAFKTALMYSMSQDYFKGALVNGVSICVEEMRLPEACTITHSTSS